jgi:hypothetical protein
MVHMFFLTGRITWFVGNFIRLYHVIGPVDILFKFKPGRSFCITLISPLLHSYIILR